MKRKVRSAGILDGLQPRKKREERKEGEETYEMKREEGSECLMWFRWLRIDVTEPNELTTLITFSLKSVLKCYYGRGKPLKHLVISHASNIGSAGRLNVSSFEIKCCVVKFENTLVGWVAPVKRAELSTFRDSYWDFLKFLKTTPRPSHPLSSSTAPLALLRTLKRTAL